MRVWIWGAVTVLMLTAGCAPRTANGSHGTPARSISSATTSSNRAAKRLTVASPLLVTQSRLVLPAPAFWSFHDLDFVSPTSGYAVASRGPRMAVLYSGNSGKTWTERITDSKILQLDMVSASTGWMTACAGAACTLKRTVNGGRSWMTVMRVPVRDHVQIDFISSAVGWLERSAPPHNTPVLYRTTDGGTHWSLVNASPPSYGWAFSNSLDFINPHDGWLAVGGEGGVGEQVKAVYHTTDGGYSWAKIAVSANLGSSQKAPLPVGGYLNQIAFINAQVGYMTLAGPMSAVLRTADGGHHWTVIRSTAFPLGGTQASDPTFPSTSVGYVVGWDAASVWNTMDGGMRWTTQYPPLHPTQVVGFRNAQDGLGFGTVADGGLATTLIRSSDGGRTWTTIGDSSTTFWNLQWTGPHTVWALGDGLHTGTRVYVSRDGGSQFVPVALPVQGAAEGIAMTPPSGGIVVIGTASRSEMLTTHDGGQRWTAVTLPFAARVVARSGHDDLWALGSAGQSLYYSTNNGQTWIQQALPGAAYRITQPRTLRFLSASFGYLWGSNSLMTTDNGGETWHLATAPASVQLNAFDFVSPNKGWLVDGSNLGFYTTTNGGKTWGNSP